MSEAVDIKKGISKDSMKDYFTRSAKAWQAYTSYEFIKGIELSSTQKRVLNTEGQQVIIRGSAGSGKSIVLLYKLIKLMKDEKTPKKFLYITYNQTLIEDIKKRAAMSEEYRKYSEKHNVDICTFHDYAGKILSKMSFSVDKIKVNYTNVKKMRGNTVRRIAGIADRYIKGGKYYDDLSKENRLYKSHDLEFIRDEILWMKANGFITEESYRECERAGRGNVPRLTKAQRETIYCIFVEYGKEKRTKKWGVHSIDLEDFAIELNKRFSEIPEKLMYDYIFVDEAQDFDPMQIKYLLRNNAKAIVLAEDPKQKIYKRTPHSYAKLGIDIVSNGKELYENYRSTEEIMKVANSLDFEDSVKDSTRIKYMNFGDKPKIFLYKKWTTAIKDIGERIKEIQIDNPKSTIAIVTREEDDRAKGNKSEIKTMLGKYGSIMSIEQYGYNFEFGKEKQIVFTDLYNVKGLEFDFVFLLHFDMFHYPLNNEFEILEKYKNKEKNEDIEVDAKAKKDLDELINTEKKRLYVAMSRAKKELNMICVGEDNEIISPFIKDFDKKDYVFKAVKR